MYNVYNVCYGLKSLMLRVNTFPRNINTFPRHVKRAVSWSSKRTQSWKILGKKWSWKVLEKSWKTGRILGVMESCLSEKKSWKSHGNQDWGLQKFDFDMLNFEKFLGEDPLSDPPSQNPPLRQSYIRPWRGGGGHLYLKLLGNLIMFSPG